MLLLSCRLWLHTHSELPIASGTNLETMLSVKWHKMAAVIPQVGAGLLDARGEVFVFCLFFLYFGRRVRVVCGG